MPDVCYGDVEWVPVRPGTDMAFVLSVMEVMIREKLADFDFLAKHTNAAYLIRENGAPLTEADVKKGGAADRFALFDEKTAGLVFQGVKRDEKGNAVGFIESADTKPVLDYTGDVLCALSRHHGALRTSGSGENHGHSGGQDRQDRPRLRDFQGVRR